MRRRARGVGHEAEGGAAVLLVVLVVVAMCASGWVAAYAGAEGKVPRGTTVAGVDIGGLDRLAASAALTEGLAREASGPLTVTVGATTTSVDPVEAGLSVDAVATVVQVLGPRSWDPRRLWRHYTGGGEVEPVVDVDMRRMTALLDRLDAEAGQPPRDAGISLAGGQVSLTEPRDGAQVDRERAVAELVDAFADRQTSVQLPLRLVPPEVDADDLGTAVSELANPAVSGPVTLRFADSEVVLAPRRYADLLSVVAEDGALALDVDPAGLAALVDPATRAREPVDARVSIEDGVPVVVPAVLGETYDESGVAEAFLQAVTGEGSARTVTVVGTQVAAAFTDDDAAALGVTTSVASFSVPAPAAAGESFGAAVARLSGTLLRPGETFSFHARVGPDTGSATRLATATWNAGFLAGLTDVARTPSPVAVAGLPAGRDALVDAATDLQLRNDTPHGVLLEARVADGSVTVVAWSTREYDVAATTGAPYAPVPRGTVVDASPACVADDGADGFSVDLVRTVTRVSDATVVRSDTVSTTYLPEPAVVCQPAPTPAPVVPPVVPPVVAPVG